MNSPFELVVPSNDVRLHVVGHPVANPRGGIVIAPGFAEHAGRYARLMTDLAARGYASFLIEPRGHGTSTGPRGHTPSWAALQDDLTAAIDALESERRLPARRALFGASMGGLVAAEWVPAHPGRFSGLVLVAPFLAPAKPLPPLKVALADLVTGVLPRLSQSHGLRGRDLSHDATVVAAYDADPFLVRVMSARYFTEMRAAQARVKAAIAAGPAGTGAILDAPVLLLQGAADPVASAAAAQSFMKLAPAPGSEARVYPGMFHEPLNELDRNRVLADMARWLDRNILGTNRIGA
jgi:alpha-beta hydrolase superfamily lysophospholipase